MFSLLITRRSNFSRFLASNKKTTHFDSTSKLNKKTAQPAADPSPTWCGEVRRNHDFDVRRVRVSDACGQKDNTSERRGR